jgi:hypothetical protein
VVIKGDAMLVAEGGRAALAPGEYTGHVKVAVEVPALVAT